MARIKQPWEIREEELERQENAYLEKYNWLEKIFDNHLYFCLLFVILLMAGFNLGFLIGMML